MKLVDIARVIRSKNAGPSVLTLDVFFVDAASMQRWLDAGGFATERLAGLYGCAPEAVRVMPIAALAVTKISVPRTLIAGTPGDRDVYGAQQHAPLLGLQV